MPLPIEIIEAEALGLPVAERSRLIEKLVSSIEIDPGAEEEWAVEVARRLDEIEHGTVTLLSGPEALAKLRAELL